MPPHPPLALWAASLPFITGSESSTVFPLSSPGANYTTYTVALRHSVYDDNFVQVKELLSEYCKQLELGTAISVFSSILQTSGHCTPYGGVLHLLLPRVSSLGTWEWGGQTLGSV